MEQLRNYGDERQVAWCVYCGAQTETRDHVPSRVFLDEPYPSNLPVVPACKACNAGFSLDEEYLACLVDCATVGSASVEAVRRGRVRKILGRKTALSSMLIQARSEWDDRAAITADADRLRNVILKLARGHAAYELNEPRYDEPLALGVLPFPSMYPDARTAFETPPRPSIWPEVGSHATQRVAVSFPASPGWIDVQPGRYRYLAAVGNSIVVRMVLSEYLACEVVW